MNHRKTLMALLIMLGVCAMAFMHTGAVPSSAAAAPRAGTYVGQVEGEIDLIGIDVTQADVKNRRIVRAYLCDGEPGGDALWFTGVTVGNKVRLNSIDGTTNLEVKLGHDVATGSLVFADGSVRGFSAARAAGGGGIYDIELKADGTAQGVSFAGDTFIATKSPVKISDIGDGKPWDVTVTTVNGETFHYTYHDFTTFSAEELASRWLPTSYGTTGASGIQPDLYTVVWFTGGYRFGFGGLIFGRSGDVKKGVPGTNIWPGGADPT